MWCLTIVKCPDHGVVLQVLSDSREVNLYRYVQLVQNVCPTDARHLEQSGRDDGASGKDDLLFGQHLLTGSLGGCGVL